MILGNSEVIEDLLPLLFTLIAGVERLSRLYFRLVVSFSILLLMLQMLLSCLSVFLNALKLIAGSDLLLRNVIALMFIQKSLTVHILYSVSLKVIDQKLSNWFILNE